MSEGAPPAAARLAVESLVIIADRTLRARMSTYGLWVSGGSIFKGTLSLAGQQRSRDVPVDTEVPGVVHLRTAS